MIVEMEKKVKKLLDINKEDFDRYEKVRNSGRTNMFNLINVSALSGLSKDKIRAIQENYEELMKIYS